MTPEAAIYSFLSAFMDAYPSTAVPHDAEYPYLTYDIAVGDWGSLPVNMPVSLWFYGDSEAAPNAKVREIGQALGLGGVTIKCDGGMLWLKKGSPWAQAVTDPDDKVKRRYLNVTIETFVL